MRITAFAHELLTLGHAELVLLVDDDQAEIGQAEAGSEQGVRSDEDGGWRMEDGRARAFSVFHPQSSILAAFAAAGLQNNIHTKRRKPFLKISEVLFRQ